MERGQVYKCTDSGIMIEILEGGQPTNVCSEQDMRPLPERGQEQEGKEKHVPVVEKKDGLITVRVGSTLHPMEEDHWIQWIELRTATKSYRQFLQPGEEPIVRFPPVEEAFTVRELCNKHGLWKTDE